MGLCQRDHQLAVQCVARELHGAQELTHVGVVYGLLLCVGYGRPQLLEPLQGVVDDMLVGGQEREELTEGPPAVEPWGVGGKDRPTTTLRAVLAQESSDLASRVKHHTPLLKGVSEQTCALRPRHGRCPRYTNKGPSKTHLSFLGAHSMAVGIIARKASIESLPPPNKMPAILQLAIEQGAQHVRHNVCEQELLLQGGPGSMMLSCTALQSITKPADLQKSQEHTLWTMSFKYVES